MITLQTLKNQIALDNINITYYCKDKYDNKFLKAMLKAIKKSDTNFSFLKDDFLSNYEKELIKELLSYTFEYFY